jgi:hypothetical protein
MREFQGKAALAVGALYVGFVGWSVYGAIWPVETYAFRMVHMAFIYALALIVYPIRPKAGRWALGVDLLLAILGVAAIAYGFIDMDQFIRRSTLPERYDMVFGIMAMLLLLEISRRTVDNTFTLVVIGFLIYTLYGNYFPDIISHKGYDLDRIVGHMYMTLEGIFGVPLSVSASFVMLFVVYGPSWTWRGPEASGWTSRWRRWAPVGQRRAGRGHHLGAPGGTPGKRGGDHDVRDADHVADPQEGGLYTEHGGGAHRHRRDRGSPLAAADGGGCLSDHAVSGGFILGRGGHGDDPHGPVLRRDPFYGGAGGTPA